MTIGKIISALTLCASDWGDDKDYLLMLREVYSIEDKGEYIEVNFVDGNTDNIRIYRDGRKEKILYDE